MRKTIDALTRIEAQALITFLEGNVQFCQGKHKRCRNKLMATLMIDTGIRVGELTQLLLGDIWFAGGPVKSLIIRAKIAKNKQERTIPISYQLSETIQEYHNNYYTNYEGLATAYLFWDPISSRPLGIRQIQRIIKTAGIICLKKKITPHTLRHTFATRLMTVTSMRIVQQLMGHKNIQTTQIYTHPNGADLKEAIDKLNV